MFSRKAPDAAVKQNILLLLALDHNLGKQMPVTDTSLRHFLISCKYWGKTFREIRWN